MSWIKERLDEKQIVLEQQWLRDFNAMERHPARNIEEAWGHMVAAIERDIDEFNALKLCGHQQVKVVTGPDRLTLLWRDHEEPLLKLEMRPSEETFSYLAGGGKQGKILSGILRVRPRRGSNAILYDGRPTPFTYEEASQFLLQPLLMP